MDKTGPPSPSHPGLGTSLRRERETVSARIGHAAIWATDRPGWAAVWERPDGESTTFFAALEGRSDPVQVRELRTLQQVSHDSAQGRALRLVGDQLDSLGEGFPAPIVV